MKLVMINEQYSNALDNVMHENDLISLGYECKGRLCEYKYYENFYERLWVWAKQDNKLKTIEIIVTVDYGGNNCEVMYKNMCVVELLER